MDWLLAVVVLPPTMIATTLVLAGIERRLLHGGRPPRAPARPPLPRASGEQPVVHRE